ncbi:MAG: hypothetical protein J6M90_07150 [Oscillospiraceae bacterium]|nr:hypothetical protein [Oscillospiraceae bacterium]
MRSKIVNLNRSYVISVAAGKGCYRHLQVPAGMTLDEFADMILWAFDFDNDHAHAFFMDNKVWSDRDCYYEASADDENEYRHTNNYTFLRAGIKKGDEFIFLFDFGDEWIFRCKVLKELDEATEEPAIIRRKGEPPRQYPDYDEYDDHDDDYDDEDGDDDYYDDEPHCLPAPYVPLTDEMLDAAFEYRRSKVSKKLGRRDIFAIPMPGGDIAYCGVSPAEDDHGGLCVYLGQQGWDTYELITGEEYASDPDINTKVLLTRNHLTCAFAGKDFIPGNVMEDILDYTGRKGISLRGRNAYPIFFRFLPCLAPQPINEEPYRTMIVTALRAAAALAEELKTSSRAELCLTDSSPSIPLVDLHEGKVEISYVKRPSYSGFEYPSPKVTSTLSTKTASGVYEAEFYYADKTLAHDDIPGAPQFYPPILLIVNSRGRSFCATSDIDVEKHPSALVNDITDSLNGAKKHPKVIKVRNERSRALLEDFCRANGITLTMTDELKHMDAAKAELMEKHFTAGDDDDDGDDEELRELSQKAAPMVKLLKQMAAVHPEALSEMFKQMDKDTKSLLLMIALNLEDAELMKILYDNLS